MIIACILLPGLGAQAQFTCDWFHIRPQTKFDSSAMVQNKVRYLRVYGAWPDSAGNFKEDWSLTKWKLETREEKVKAIFLEPDSFRHCLPVITRKIKNPIIVDVIKYDNVKYQVTHILTSNSEITRSETKILKGGYTENNFDYIEYYYENGLLKEMHVYLRNWEQKPAYKYMVEYSY